MLGERRFVFWWGVNIVLAGIKVDAAGLLLGKAVVLFWWFGRKGQVSWGLRQE